MGVGLAGLLLLQQQIVAYSSPPSGDTAGYWQQRVHYTVRATLDEEAQLLRARGTMRYVNASPDTLRELYFHQYLNAFRPHSRWSAADAREHRQRFQSLVEPHHGFERLSSYDWPTARGPGVLVARGDGSDETLVQVQYPFAPDSTVAHVPLPESLAPGDSLSVSFEWEARPSTVFRRQGRRGRHWDFAQWYPKVAVYDRSGWAFNPFVPQGELYGEFGTYDVTLVVRQDQVVGATGVPVSGDPGWERVRRAGEMHDARDAYGERPPDDSLSIPAGHRAVRFLARDVHHFAWTVSPLYRYEGDIYDGRVAIHVLYRPGDESTWGAGTVIERTKRALQWLEWLFGPYAYPQITLTHRLDVGATEFPMILMNASPSQGLILHELGHAYAYGMLANNEWRAGWMDEGLTDYQTAWAQNLTAPERARGLGPPPSPPPKGYRRRAVRPETRERTEIERYRRVMLGRAQPIGTMAADFDEFALYQGAVYTTSEAMFGALREAVGDSAFVRFHRLYFARWRFKHVDELALRRAAEDACGCALAWFFDQWVHGTGLIDYKLRGAERRSIGSDWLWRSRLVRRGAFAHPAPVGARTDSGWTLTRGAPLPFEQQVEIRTSTPPRDGRVDPHRVTDDWDRRNDVRSVAGLADPRVTRHVIDWPFLDQALRDRNVAAWLPMAWYGDAGGPTAGVRLRTNYLGFVDRDELGLVVSARAPDGANEWTRLQLWVATENPKGGPNGMPRMGLRASVWMLGGIGKGEARKRWDLSPFIVARGPKRTLTLSLTGTEPYDMSWLDERRWRHSTTVDASVELEQTSTRGDLTVRALALGGHSEGAFGRAEAEAERVLSIGGPGRTELRARLFAGFASERTPVQRSLGISSRDPTETFANHLLRPVGAPLVRRDVGFLPLGHGALRGFTLFARTDAIAAGNVELSRLIRRGTADLPGLWLTAFGDVAAVGSGARDDLLGDAGIGIALRGMLYDRPIRVRFDLPLYVSEPRLAATRTDVSERFAFRWSFSIER